MSKQDNPLNATLTEVLESLVEDDPSFDQAPIKRVLKGDNLNKIRVRLVGDNGITRGTLEKRFKEGIAGLKESEGMSWDYFVSAVLAWSKPSFKRQRTEALEPHERYKEIGSPSTYGAGQWTKLQKNPNLELMCLRPAQSAWINARIMHPVFPEMIRTLSSTPEDVDYELAECLRVGMPESFSVEGGRRDEINKILNAKLFLRQGAAVAVTMIANAYDTDGSVAGCGLTVEYQNEKGTGTSDAYLQNAAYYTQYWLGKDGPKKHCCPWILVEVFGPYIGLSGAVWAGGKPTIQPITTIVPFLPVPSDHDFFLEQVRLCKALRIGFTMLRNWYRDVAPSIPVSPQAAMPYPRTAKFGTSEEVEFEYKNAIGVGARKMIFVAERKDNNEKIFVKFSEAGYGTEVHQALAGAGFAPTLYDIKNETGLCMVVMEFIDESEPIAVNEVNRANLELQLKQLLAILDTGNFVHGDLRKPNVHVREDKVIVFDFDWAGRAGTARYPHKLNPELTWATGAAAGRPITKAHDTFMVDKLLSS